MPDHTEGPVEVRASRQEDVVHEFWDETGTICVALIPSTRECQADTLDMKRANTRRLRAAWNLVEGIPTEMLEALIVVYSDVGDGEPLREFVDDLATREGQSSGYSDLWRVWAREEPETLKERAD